jgi:Ca-activated chloride channel family protein
MTLRLLISLSLLLLAWQKASAQLAPAEDFFNGGAQLYISNNIPAALERTEMGLKTYPDDAKLKKLEELLKQKQQQQNQQNQQQQQDQKNQQQQKDQQKKSDEQKKQNQQNQKQDSQPKQDQQNQTDQKKDEQPKPQDQKKDAGDKPKDEKQEQQQQGQPVKPGEMTPEEAKRLLDAQKGNEQLLQMKPKDKPEQRPQPLKDW